MTEQSTILIPLSEETNMNRGFPSCRPWKETVQSLELPSGFGNTIERMKTNLVYFRTNYMIILMLILILSFLYHPVMFWMSLSLLLNVYAVFHRPYRKFLVVLVIFTAILLVLVNDPAAWNFKWTLFIEAVVVAAHASFRNTDDLSLDLDQVPPLAIGLPGGRPWKEMIRLPNLPTGSRNTMERMKTNLVYFQTNYILILIWLILSFSLVYYIRDMGYSDSVILSFLYRPVSLRGQWALFMAFLMLLYSIRTTEPLLAIHPLINERSFVLALSIITVILVALLDNAVWIITSTLLIEALVVAAHSLVRRTEDLSNLSMVC